MIKPTKHTLKKLEELFKECEYTIRYAKGNFQSGYCIVENKKVAVLNKFFQTEARVNTLIDILSQIEVDANKLSHTSQKLFVEIEKMNLANKKSEDLVNEESAVTVE